MRSGIHMFAPDSGAQSIAGMDVHVTGGLNIIALLALWAAPPDLARTSGLSRTRRAW